MRGKKGRFPHRFSNVIRCPTTIHNTKRYQDRPILRQLYCLTITFYQESYSRFATALIPRRPQLGLLLLYWDLDLRLQTQSF